MRQLKRSLVVLLAAAALASCTGSDRIHETDGGGVTLSITDFDGLPIQVSVNAAGGFVQIEELTIENIPKNPNAITSDLMNVELDSYEVTFTRADTGTRIPPPLVQKILGVVPVRSTSVYNNLPIMAREQIESAPLSDLLFQNGGFDRETGDQHINVNCALRFFGRTVSGERVDSNTANFTIEFLP